MARHGDVIHADVPQEVVYFGDQLLIEPNCQLAALQEKLRLRTLDSLLLTFREHVDALRLHPANSAHRHDEAFEGLAELIRAQGGIREALLVRPHPTETGVYEDLLAAGINDPVKVTRSALQNAASIAALFLTTEAVVADKPEKAAAPAGDPTGGMGGMDF